MNRQSFLYTPLTANPFRNSRLFRELLPCPVLRGMIRCFWGGEARLSATRSETIIPDTCCDLIYRVNETTGEVTGHFSGISSEPFPSHAEEKDISLFGIRFFAWQACRFSDDTLRGTLNLYTHAEEHFARLDRELRMGLTRYRTLEERAGYAERLLLSFPAGTVSEPVQSAVDLMLGAGRIADISRLARSVFVSTRQLERLFAEYMGLSPKKLGSLIRYQRLWRDALTDPRFTVADAVGKYGYFDEAHLHHEFLRYHGVNLKAAVRLARKDVAFLQDSACAPGLSCR